jgi:murein DD-endopeptidase MepM/ murein hydrolase activator NlpD
VIRRTLVCLALLAMVAGAVPAGAADPSAELEQVRSEIKALESKINTARAESRRVGEQLAAAQAHLDVATAEFVEAQARVDEVAARIAEEEARYEAISAELVAVERQLEETTARLHSTQETLELQAVELYMQATSSTITTLVLGFEDVSDATVGLAYADDVASDTEDTFDTFEFLRREEDRQRTVVQDRRQEAADLLVTLEGERTALAQDAARMDELRVAAEAELSTVKGLLSSIRTQIAQAEEHKDGLEADAARLQAELRRLQSTGGTKPGVLGWPVAGRMSSPFGYRIHPIFGTKRLHTGIDISAGSGTTISAAGDGKVILSGPYGGYGNAVVIDHGGGLATLYAHQSRIVVSVGTRVVRGETIGYVGCTGFCTGPHLHFETREGGTPVDPMKYLSG